MIYKNFYSYTSYTPTQGIDAKDYGIYPNGGNDITTKLQSAMTAARVAGVPLIVDHGKYIYSGMINNAGGGIVCTNGEAWFDNQDPTYTNTRIDFASTDGSYLNGIVIKGIRFTCSTRPDSGLTNSAPETAAFLRFYKCRNVKVLENKFQHNWGGAVLFRDVQDSIMYGNEATDMWKDCFHITADVDGSFNNIRAFNTVRGAGDDAFAVVGYVTKGVMPVGIVDICNKVYGVRVGRAFAYVGCKDIKNIGCYVDGNLPVYIPQQSNTGIAKYNTSCAVYIGAESGFNTYGCENIEITGLIGENLGPSIDTSGNPLTGIGTYQQIHIAASNGTGNPHKNIKINASMRNGASRSLFVVGNGAVQGIDADIICEDNTDPTGILSLTSVGGTGNQHAVEFQNTRNIKLKLRANKIAKGAVWIDANCSGYANIDASVGSVCQTTSGQSVITVASSSKLDVADFTLNFESSPTSSGVGSINRLIDNPNQGITRTCHITGVDHAPAVANSVNGVPFRTLTLTGSPSTIMNTTGRSLLLWFQGGTVSNISRTGIKGRAVATNVVTGASGTVSINGDFTDLYTAATIVDFFNARGVLLATGTVSSSSLTGGVTTVVFDATGVNAGFATGMQMGIPNAMKTIQGRTNGIIELPPENCVQVTYSSVPSCKIGESTY